MGFLGKNWHKTKKRILFHWVMVHSYRKNGVNAPSKRAGALKIAKKTEQTPQGASIFLFIEKRPGAFFFTPFREEGLVG